MTKSAYPLSWPAGERRTPAADRHRANFGKMRQAAGENWKSRHKISLEDAGNRLDDELRRMGIDSAQYTLSTNVPLRRDGWPYSRYAHFDDVGVAVYFMIEGQPVSPCCDKWDRVEDNVVAIAKHIESLRGQERWGVATLKQAFAGHLALPDPNALDWRSVLGLHKIKQPTKTDVKEAYKHLARTRHPDTPTGSVAMMSDLNRSRDLALREVG